MGSVQSFHATMREVLDYRKWFEFQLECQKTGEKKKELTDRVFFTFSGGEKAMAMYVPLFSAVVAKYAGARPDAPKLISLDEAFAGVDETNIRDMFRLMVEFEFNFMINSQILWGDYDTVPGLAIYQLIRPENAKFVTVMPYLWNGHGKELLDDDQVPIYNYVVGREAFAEKYPEITEKVLELINDTWDYADSHQDEYIKFYADASGQDVATVEAAWKDNFPQRYASDFSDDDKKAYEEFVDWMKSVDYVGKDVDSDSLLDLSYMEKISQTGDEQK